MNNNHSVLDSALLQGTLTVLGILLVLTALYGLMLLVSPNLGLRFNRSLSQWFSLRRLGQFLDRQFHIERYFYRHAKLYGLLLIVGSGYLLYRLFFDFPLENYAGILPGILPTDVWGWLLETLRIFLVLIGIFTLYIGLVVLIRPSNIKGLEQQANRWIATGQRPSSAGYNTAALDNVAARAPRLFGGIVFLASIVILFILL
ncbi:hypothetical protein [Thiohalophilus sp.]|uniref:hypothetical protein n=1 Tax=Thiohalophilus sp. TaxID=3028392 RepID=UPI002ACD9DFE|nr:hypothetical protein [Thiohalophilus sp.]MDZ7803404.1 hypothetical protein [Thiohalophilus sp.]